MSEMTDRKQRCYEKATAKGMPTFTLIASDPTASLLVTAWADANQMLRENLGRGVSLDDAINLISGRLHNAFFDLDGFSQNAKLVGARHIAIEMEIYPEKKVAD